MGIPRWARQRQPAGDPRTPATLPRHARLCTSPRPRTSTPHLLVQMHGHRDPARSTSLLVQRAAASKARQVKSSWKGARRRRSARICFLRWARKAFFSFHERTMQVRWRRARGQRPVPGHVWSSCSLHASFVIRAASMGASGPRLGFMDWGRRFRVRAAHMAW